MTFHGALGYYHSATYLQPWHIWNSQPTPGHNSPSMLGKTSSCPPKTARLVGTSKVKYQHECLQDFAKQKHHKGWLWAEAILRNMIYISYMISYIIIVFYIIYTPMDPHAKHNKKTFVLLKYIVKSTASFFHVTPWIGPWRNWATATRHTQPALRLHGMSAGVSKKTPVLRPLLELSWTEGRLCFHSFGVRILRVEQMPMIK